MAGRRLRHTIGLGGGGSSVSSRGKRGEGGEAREARRERRGDGSEAVGARRRERCPRAGEDGQKRRFPARAIRADCSLEHESQGKGWCAGFYQLTKMPANGEVGSDPRVGVVFQRSAVPPRSACACASWRAGGLSGWVPEIISLHEDVFAP